MEKYFLQTSSTFLSCHGAVLLLSDKQSVGGTSFPHNISTTPRGKLLNSDLNVHRLMGELKVKSQSELSNYKKISWHFLWLWWTGCNLEGGTQPWSRLLVQIEKCRLKKKSLWFKWIFIYTVFVSCVSSSLFLLSDIWSFESKPRTINAVNDFLCQRPERLKTTQNVLRANHMSTCRIEECQWFLYHSWNMRAENWFMMKDLQTCFKYTVHYK